MAAVGRTATIGYGGKQAGNRAQRVFVGEPRSGARPGTEVAVRRTQSLMLLSRRKRLQGVSTAEPSGLRTVSPVWAGRPGGSNHACSNTMSHSNLKVPGSRDAISLQVLNAGSRCRAVIVDIRMSFSLSGSPGKYICATRR
jgi:hypothetical protein